MKLPKNSLLRAVRQEKRLFGLNPYKAAFDRLLREKPGYRERYRRMLAACAADNEAFWARQRSLGEERRP
jgi:hypothetical protein